MCVCRVGCSRTFGLDKTLNLLRPHMATLVDTLHWRHGLALVLIEGGTNDAAVREVNLAVGLLLPAKRVLHPVLIVTVREVFPGVSATRFLAVRGGGGGLGTVSRFC